MAGGTIQHSHAAHEIIPKDMCTTLSAELRRRNCEPRIRFMHTHLGKKFIDESLPEEPGFIKIREQVGQRRQRSLAASSRNLRLQDF
jgi:hypothetical protein